LGLGVRENCSPEQPVSPKTLKTIKTVKTICLFKTPSPTPVIALI